jgi:Lectin C-type domain
LTAVHIYKFSKDLAWINDDYWVYGTDNGSPGNFHWCSNEKLFEPKEVKWAPGEPNSQFHCVYLKNMGSNKSVLATADCNSEKKFLCDVRKKATGGLAMQQECMETWGVSAGRRSFKMIFVNLKCCLLR